VIDQVVGGTTPTSRLVQVLDVAEPFEPRPGHTMQFLDGSHCLITTSAAAVASSRLGFGLVHQLLVNNYSTSRGGGARGSVASTKHESTAAMTATIDFHVTTTTRVHTAVVTGAIRISIMVFELRECRAQTPVVGRH
jgi:hypothetical protein